MKTRPRLDIVFFPLLFLGGTSCAKAATDSAFQQRTISVDAEAYAYQVFVPTGWTADRRWPVVLFLHGAGERGTDGVAHTRVGLPATLLDQPDFPAVVVMPQCPRGSWWGDAAIEKRVMAALDDAIAAFNGDTSRLYLTGLSLGGYGTWAFGYRYPRKFAALVPVCGGVRRRSRMPPPDWHPAAQNGQDIYALTARGIGSTPVWAFHGEADGTIPVTESRQLVDALRQVGGNVRYTEYPGVGHNSWDLAYLEPGLWDWVFQQQLP